MLERHPQGEVLSVEVGVSEVAAGVVAVVDSLGVAGGAVAVPRVGGGVAAGSGGDPEEVGEPVASVVELEAHWRLPGQRSVLVGVWEGEPVADTAVPCSTGGATATQSEHDAYACASRMPRRQQR